MMIWLDRLIFGSGRGIGPPAYDSRLYWLVDGHTKKGALYSWSGWFGTQLASQQWTRPLAGEKRLLHGREFIPLHSTRRWLRVQVAWGTKLPDDIDKANAILNELQARLGTSR